MPIRNLLPKGLRTPLWGDRARWALTPVPEEACWKEWPLPWLPALDANLVIRFLYRKSEK